MFIYFFTKRSEQYQFNISVTFIIKMVISYQTIIVIGGKKFHHILSRIFYIMFVRDDVFENNIQFQDVAMFLFYYIMTFINNKRQKDKKR